jgi:cation diffusion facilitator CzcD-associated flavoprotein CzcO
MHSASDGEHTRAPLDVLVIGTGFGGLCAGIKLQEAGIDRFLIVEQADDLGGTWRDNRYPGAACDVQSHLYSYSFFPWPHWTRAFAQQAEIWDYMRACVSRYGLESKLRFKTRVTALAFDAARGVWEVEAACGARFEARAVISATGGLSRPVLPTLPNLDRFGGEAFHTARWPAGAALGGKRVGVIGTGASAIQVIPAIAGQVGHLTVFQRTAPWVLSRPDHPISEAARRRFARFPALQWLERQRLYWRLEARGAAFVVAPRALAVAEGWGRDWINAQVQDPALRAKVTPTFRIGCKRILMSNDYYAALQRPNVTLTSAAADVSEGGVTDADGQHHPLDALIFATGFDAAESLSPFGVKGLGGRDLNETWRAQGGAEAYRGTTIAGFPNLFLLAGPNTGLGHSSMIFMLEAQVRYVLEALSLLRARGLRYVDVKPEAQRRYNDGLQARLQRTIWASGCQSWYRTREGKNTTLWPGFTAGFWLQMRRFDPDRYDLTR